MNPSPKGGDSPLADRIRPRRLVEVVGQEHLTGPGKILERACATDRIPSLIFWGPPGCGKTTLARIIASETHHRFEAMSAVLSGVKDVREVVERAKEERRTSGLATILFMDEIHRFNKAQQDAFLPHVEDGSLILMGATTENPSFQLNGALLSRCRVVVLQPLGEKDIIALLERALADPERGFGGLGVQVAPAVLQEMAAQCDGDARFALNLLESLVQLCGARIEAGAILDKKDLEQTISRRAALYDRDGEAHFNLISALHKSLRGSDPDAGLYWLARMLEGGEDGLYIARRLVRFASEDVGNADPQALALTLQAMESYRFLGSPEGDLALAQAVVYLATAPKSNSLYTAFGRAQEAARKEGSLPVPLHIRNAPTGLMKSLGYGAGYRYAHDYEGGYVAQDYLPDRLVGTCFYQPVERGFERTIAKRLAYWRRLKQGAKPSE